LSAFCYDPEMRDFVILLVHLILTLARLASPGGIRSVVAESVLVKRQRSAFLIKHQDHVLYGADPGFAPERTPADVSGAAVGV